MALSKTKSTVRKKRTVHNKVKKQKRLLKTSKYFTYDKTIKCYGIDVEIYCDDYGQSNHIAFLDNNGNLRQFSCGIYNFDVEGTARYFVKEHYY